LLALYYIAYYIAVITLYYIAVITLYYIACITLQYIVYRNKVEKEQYFKVSL